MTTHQLRQILLDLLASWASATLTTAEVHEAAERLMAQWDWGNWPRDSPASIVNEVLAQLDLLNQQLIVPDDIPAIQTFLLAPAGSEAQAWKIWESYWEDVDYEDRSRRLHDNSDYAV